MDENKELTRGERLRKDLAYERKNGYDRVEPEELEAMEAYCTGYKQFLDAGKTELECVDRAVALAQGAGLWQEIRRTAEGNSALDTGALMPTYLTLGVLAVMDLVPALLCCQILRWGGRLALGLEEDPFGGETVALAEELGGRCAWVAGLSAGVCVAGNLLQFLLLPVLHSARFNVSFPFAAILLAASLGLLCRYFRRAKAVSDDNGTII